MKKINCILILIITLSVFFLFGCKKEHTVTFESVEGELYEVLTVQDREKIDKPIDPIREGYTFMGWFYKDEQWSFIEHIVTENMTLIAQWQINQYTITFDTDGGSIIEPITKDYNSPIDIPENPTRAGYEFIGWDQELPLYMPSENINIKAIWRKNILIGCSGPLSGSASIYGQAVKKGIELAIEEINAAGGVNVDGKMMKLELVDFVNDQADAGKAAAGFKELVSKNVDIVIGAVTSGATEGLISEAKKYGVPVITPTGTADKLTVGEDGNQRAERENVFRACFYDSYQGKYMAKYAKDAGYTKAYVLFNKDDSYSVGLKDAFVAEAAVQGVTVEAVGYPKTTTDFTSYWAPVLAGEYQCVYVPDYYENVYNILKTGYAAGYTGVCYGGDGWDGVIQQVKYNDDISFLENCFYTNHYFGGSESAAVKKFIEAYKAKYDGEVPVSFAALAYDAVYIAKQAIETAGSVEYAKVVEALTNGTFTNLVTSSEEFKFVNGNPEKAATVITFKDGKEVEAK